MNNPNGPYPGRQLFLGKTANGDPCFAYLITGRSPESRERKGLLVGESVRIGPLGNQPYDPLRHYAALKYDKVSGIVAVSNGIQTEAILETYRLLFNTASIPARDYMEKILDGADAEPDSYHTPRIAGIITYANEKEKTPVFIIGIKAYNVPARAIQVNPGPGSLIGISTYKGSMENPEPRNPVDALPEIGLQGNTAEEIAQFVFEISAASYKGNDIRVCSLGGIHSARGWVLAINNVHK
jgi:IMP cyclohydrolase